MFLTALLAPAFAACAAPAPVFRSAESGAVQLRTIAGSTAAPWSNPPKTLELTLADDTRAALFARWAAQHRALPSASIDDPADGEFYTLRGVTVTAYRPQTRVVSLRVEHFHLTCGPPTCMQR